MKQIAIFTTPEDAAVELRHDAGPVFLGVRGVASGRPAHLLTIDGVPDGFGARLVVSRDGYTSIEQRGILWLTRPGTYAEFDVDDVQLPKAATARPAGTPALHVEGRDFVTSAGDRHVIIGSTELMLAWRYDVEGADAIRPIFQERCRDIGFNNFRCLWQKDLGNTGHALWLMPPEKMPPFLALAAEYDCYIQGTILADCQGQQGADAQHGRVAAVREATAGIANHVEQLGNEFSKNDLDPRQFSKPTDRLAANASNVEGGPYAPFWDFMCFSGQRSPLNHAIREYGPIEFMYGAVASGVNIPAICDEGMKPGINSSDPRDFERAGAQARSGCGGRLHSSAGTSGNSCLFSDLERACAVAFVRGIGR